MSAVTHGQFIQIAKTLAESSNCVSLHVGAVVVVENRIRCIGYNGTPAGCLNCSELFGFIGRGAAHTAWSHDHEIHAEMNAILYAAAEGLSIKGGIMYSSVEPCKNCLKHMIGAQLSGIVFETPYYNESTEDKMVKYELAKESGFQILQFTEGSISEWNPPNISASTFL